MWVIFSTALRWIAPALAGWFVSDVYNEAETTQQLSGKGIVVAAKKTIFQKWWFYLIVLGVVTVVFFILKQFKMLKK